MAILVFLEALLLFVFFWRRSGLLRASWMNAALAWGLLVTAITESLNVFGAISRPGIAIGWSIACAATVALIVKDRKPSARFTRPALTPDLIALLAGAALIILAVGLTACIAPPNTVDALRYHLPRLVAWLQNGNLGVFPAPDAQQLFQPPWAEFAMLHLFALAGGDALVNFVEWFSLIGCAIAVSLIAQRLGAGLRGQTLAAVISIAIPQGLLQASGAKNDYAEAFWLAAFTYFLLGALEDRRRQSFAKAGLSLGLALLTKGTAFVFAPGVALGCWLVAWSMNFAPKPSLATLRKIAVMGVLALLINAGHYTRNLRVFGSPLGCSSADCDQHFPFRNDRLLPSDLFSNIIRNAALHFNVFDRRVGDVAYRASASLIRSTGADPNDPATTWPGMTFLPPEPDYHEYYGSDFIHLLLIPICVVLALRLRPWRAPRGTANPGYALLGYAAGLTLAFVLFCGVLRWQPWHTRLHLPLFVLWAPFMATVLEAAAPAWLGATVGATLLMLAWPFAIENQTRPLAGATTDTAGSILNLKRYSLLRAPPSYLEIAREVDRRRCSSVGVYGYFEYPLLAALHAGFGRKVQSLSPENITAAFEPKDWKPCAVLCLGCSPQSDVGRRYRAQGDAAAAYPEGLLTTGIRPDAAPAAGAWDSHDLTTPAAPDRHAQFGQAEDLPIMGDWNHSGRPALGAFRHGQWFLEGSAAATPFASWLPNDIPVLGDWNGSGQLHIGVFAEGVWRADINGDRRWDPGDRVFRFGQAGDIPVVGDWDGTGRMRIGVFRKGYWWVDWNGDLTFDYRDRTFTFGLPGDIPVVGDWDGSGRMRIGVFRNGDWLLDINGDNTWGPEDRTVHFGRPGDLPLPLTWHARLWTFRPAR
jgi:hypothetical protein